ncbi:unnamed protein product [Caenorhabditis auriculariae]|uniref:Uncharacterized protein n=1 Tax=Caenorhabditis auriculariae TaxID=2777116 RepID=A0A8S1H6Y4_9PELO|nr:unnamed protein product [Caenorhabditis auriculariae]
MLAVIFAFFTSILLIDVTYQQRLECWNYSASAIVFPQIGHTTPPLLDYRLLSPEPVCRTQRKMPKLNDLQFASSSFVAVCEQCPQLHEELETEDGSYRCFITLPKRFELPLQWSLDRIFVVAKQQPHHRPFTDVPIHYVIVDRLPSVLRECRVVVFRPVEALKPGGGPVSALFAIVVALLSLLLLLFLATLFRCIFFNL